MKTLFKNLWNWIALVPFLLLSGCSSELFKSAYGGGYWAIVGGLVLCAAWTWCRFFLGWKLPFAIDDPDTSPKRSQGAFWFAFILTVVTIAVAWGMWEDRYAIIK